MIRFGVLGLGNIAHRFCRSLLLHQEAKLVAVASSDEKKQQMFLERYHALWATSDYQTVIDSPEVDVVYIATRHIDHARWAKAALNAKKAVLCEKPMALSEQETGELIALAKANHVFLMEALKGYFIAGFQSLKQDILVNQVIGEIKKIEASFCSTVPFQAGKYLFECGQGGALNDIGIYPLSLMEALLGSSYQTVSIVSRFHPKARVDSYFSATFVYPKGSIAYISGAIDEDQPKTAVITGTKGQVIVPFYYRPTEYTVVTSKGKTTKRIPLPFDDMYDEIQAVIDSLQAQEIEHPLYTHEKMLKLAHLQDVIREQLVKSHD